MHHSFHPTFAPRSLRSTLLMRIAALASVLAFTSCGDVTLELSPVEMFTQGNLDNGYVLRLGGLASGFRGVTKDEPSVTSPAGEIRAWTIDGTGPESAIQVEWSSHGHIFLERPLEAVTDYSEYAMKDGALVFDARVESAPSGLTFVAVDCRYPCRSAVQLDQYLTDIAGRGWQEVEIPLHCLENEVFDVSQVTKPFLLESLSPMMMAIENVRWEAHRPSTDAACNAFPKLPPPEVNEVVSLNIYVDGLALNSQFVTYEANAPTESSYDIDKMYWNSELTPAGNIGIRLDTAIDASAFNTATAKLEFDFLLADGTDPQTDLLIKVGSVWPQVSDVRLFADILQVPHRFNEWVKVSIPLQTLFANENYYESGHQVNITSVHDIFVIQPIDGNLVASFNNIRWTR